jgi:hypothetical protein
VSHIVPFDSFEQAQEMIRTAETKANASVVPKQQEIAYGTYWIRAIDDQLFFEYGYVLTQEEAEANQTRESKRAMRDAYARGYRFSRAHSLYYPEGSLGDTHIAVIWPITEEEFNSAQGCQWQLSQDIWEVEMLQRIVKEMREAKAAHPSTGSPQEGSS